MSDLRPYEAYALRYASVEGRKSRLFHRFERYGEADADLPVDCYFWVVRNADTVALIDCGFARTSAGVGSLIAYTSPIELLAQIGLTPSDVDVVLISHLHFDHIDNARLFPRARFVVGREELAFWTDPISEKPMLGVAAGREALAYIVSLAEAGGLETVQARTQVLPGVTAIPLRGHTPGHVIYEVEAENRTLVFAGDAMHYYEELELDRPYATFVDLEGMYRTYEYLRDRASAGAVLVAGHDPLVMTRFPDVSDNCVDLTI